MAALASLRDAREESLKRLSRRCGVPSSTLYDMFAGRHLPRLDAIEKVVRAYAESGEQEEQWLAVLKVLRSNSGAPRLSSGEAGAAVEATPVVPPEQLPDPAQVVTPLRSRRLIRIGLAIAVAVGLIIVVEQAGRDPAATVSGSRPSSPAPIKVVQIRNYGAARCLGVVGQSRNIGMNVVAADCSAADASQLWEVFSWQSERALIFRNKHSGYCLGILASSMAAGANAGQVSCDLSFDDHAHVWRNVWSDVAHGTVYDNAHSGDCLDLQPAASATGTRALQEQCDKAGTDTSQIWTLTSR